MSAATVISRTDLARRTRQVVEQARRGQTFIVESYGEEQVAILDIVDYRLLQAVARYHASSSSGEAVKVEELQSLIEGDDGQAAWDAVIGAYLEEQISLGRAAQLLQLSRFDLLERLNRLELPVNLGVKNIAEAQAEYDVLRS